MRRDASSVVPFETVVEQHGATVLRLCLALLPRHDAEDAWSETFLAALGAYPDLPAQANVQAWLVTIAKRKAIDRHRAVARAPEPMPDPPEPSGRAHRPPDPPGPPDHDDLRAAVRALPPAQREAIALHYLGDLPYADVAALTGRSPAAVRRAASDGVGALRRQFPEGAI
jgi:RNA polymerase sigma factor (sigma-70 family)